MIKRYLTKKIYVGDVAVGGDAPISVQSMTFSDTKDVEATLAQIKRLHFAGCDIVRVAVPDIESAYAIKEIKKNINSILGTGEIRNVYFTAFVIQ